MGNLIEKRKQARFALYVLSNAGKKPIIPDFSVSIMCFAKLGSSLRIALKTFLTRTLIDLTLFPVLSLGGVINFDLFLISDKIWISAGVIIKIIFYKLIWRLKIFTSSFNNSFKWSSFTVRICVFTENYSYTTNWIMLFQSQKKTIHSKCLNFISSGSYAILQFIDSI